MFAWKAITAYCFIFAFSIRILGVRVLHHVQCSEAQLNLGSRNWYFVWVSISTNNFMQSSIRMILIAFEQANSEYWNTLILVARLNTNRALIKRVQSSEFNCIPDFHSEFLLKLVGISVECITWECITWLEITFICNGYLS